MDEPDELDLTDEQPSPRADPLITSEATFKGPGIEFSTKAASPARGPAGVAIAMSILAVAGTLAMLGLGVLATVAGAGPTGAVVIGAAAFALTVGPGIVLIIVFRSR